MIHLDTNYLIGSLKNHSDPAGRLKVWLAQGETFAASSIAWAEFLNGPVRPDQIQRVDYLIQGNIVPFGQFEAKISAQLFNQSRRRRGSQSDCYIAAAAINAEVKLATVNRSDFMPFVAAGLLLA